MAEAPLLKVCDLSVSIAGRAVLSGVNFSIAKGAIVGLCGDSGCGKTTLALALPGLLSSPPWTVRGQVLLNSRNLAALRESDLERVRGAHIGFVFQDANLALNPVLRIRTQLNETLRAHAVERDLHELLGLVGLQDAARILDSYPHQLSGGERQRITIAQALSCRPELLVADEPFTALDGPRIVQLASLFRRLRDETGASLLIVSHSSGVLAAMTDQVLRIEGGGLALA